MTRVKSIQAARRRSFVQRRFVWAISLMYCIDRDFFSLRQLAHDIWTRVCKKYPAAEKDGESTLVGWSAAGAGRQNSVSAALQPLAVKPVLLMKLLKIFTKM